MQRSWKFVVMFVLLLAALVPSVAIAEIPKPNGWLVRDLTGSVDDATIKRLNDRVLAFNDATSVEFVAMIVPSLDGLPIEDYSLKILHEWGVGNKEKDNGIVYIWCPSAQRQRIEVGYGLEPFIPDIAANRIMEEVKARVPKEPHGPRLEAMIEAIIARLEAAKRGEAAPELQAVTKKTGTPWYKTPLFWIIVIVVVVLLIIFFAAVSDGSGGGYYGGDGGGWGGGSWGSGGGGGWGGSSGSSGGGGGGGDFSFGGGDGGGGGASSSD